MPMHVDSIFEIHQLLCVFGRSRLSLVRGSLDMKPAAFIMIAGILLTIIAVAPVDPGEAQQLTNGKWVASDGDCIGSGLHFTKSEWLFIYDEITSKALLNNGSVIKSNGKIHIITTPNVFAIALLGDARNPVIELMDRRYDGPIAEIHAHIYHDRLEFLDTVILNDQAVPGYKRDLFLHYFETIRLKGPYRH